ncbi:MAG: SCO family protein [Flavobacteriales bacterium]|nr:SCO family protein [Flavobacteriales bacterium]
MNKSSDGKKYFLLFALLLAPGLVLIFLSKSDHSFITLPYYGPKQNILVNGASKGDTIYHTIPDISLLNQFGEEVTMADFQGKFVVANFFFTRSSTNGPIMMKQMSRLQWMLEDPAYEDVAFLTHTVDPNNDTPTVLLAYGENEGVDFSRWTFVTGDSEQIHEQSLNGYLLSLDSYYDPREDVLHSNMFILLDKERRIRGYYDGTSSKEVDDLVTDIKMLKKEESLKDSEKVRS